MKTCSKCKTEYPATREYFPLEKRVKSGLDSCCKKCYGIVNRKCYWENLDRERKRGVEYYKTFSGHVVRMICAIKQRCYDLKNPAYKNYGGRGIRLEFDREGLEIWLSENNIDPRGLEIHRIDNGGNYSLGNIEFLTVSKHMKLHRSASK